MDGLVYVAQLWMGEHPVTWEVLSYFAFPVRSHFEGHTLRSIAHAFYGPHLASELAGDRLRWMPSRHKWRERWSKHRRVPVWTGQLDRYRSIHLFKMRQARCGATKLLRAAERGRGSPIESRASCGAPTRASVVTGWSKGCYLSNTSAILSGGKHPWFVDPNAQMALLSLYFTSSNMNYELTWLFVTPKTSYSNTNINQL